MYISIDIDASQIRETCRMANHDERCIDLREFGHCENPRDHSLHPAWVPLWQPCADAMIRLLGSPAGSPKHRADALSDAR